MWICIAPRREHTSKALRYGSRSQGILRLYLHILRYSLTEWTNHTCLFLPSLSWSSFIDPGGMEGWVGLTNTNTTNTNTTSCVWRDCKPLHHSKTGDTWHNIISCQTCRDELRRDLKGGSNIYGSHDVLSALRALCVPGAMPCHNIWEQKVGLLLKSCYFL